MVVSESGGNQLLNFYIDLNGDQDFIDANEHVFTDLGDVDDVWSAGYVGLCRGPGGSSAQLFDDVTVFIDNDADGILDAADDVQLSDDFASNVMSLSYDNTLDEAAPRQGRASNLTLDTAFRAKLGDRSAIGAAERPTLSQGLTDEGVLRYVYDAWNP